MDSKKFSEKQIRAGGTTGVELVSIEYKDKDYVLKTYSENKASQTGDLPIAELFQAMVNCRILNLDGIIIKVS